MDNLLDKQTFTKDKASLPYRLLKPDGYDKDGKDHYPLVVFLHGIGERGADNTKQLRNGVEEFVKDSTRKKHPCFLAVPQCPPDKTWSMVRGTRANPTFAETPTEPAALVLDLIDALCKEYRVDTDRVYLTGVSMGGYGTWDLISRKPELFAAALAVCGGGDPTHAEKLAKLPIWAFHGDKDEPVPVERSREMVAALKKAGGKPHYTEYKGIGHDSWTATYKNDDVLDWLFKQKKGQQVTSMKIRMTIEDAAVTATLDDNETARDFASLLPMTLTLQDYAQTEKISDLPKKLATGDAPRGYEPSAGDIAYYAPWGNLALFHKDFEYSAGLVRLGSIDSGVGTLRRPGQLKITITLAEKEQSH